MIRPKAKPKLLRHLMYYWKAKDLLSFIKNWYVIPLNYFGLINLSKGGKLKLKTGHTFKVRHFLEAVGLMEVFTDLDYPLPKFKNDATVIDIGANIGAFSIYAALQSPKTKVYCVEPSKTTFKTLQENIKLNSLSGQITPINAAAWGQITTLKLYSAGPSGLRSAFKSRGERNFEKVPTITLAEIFRRYHLKSCDFLKIDCEGAEYEILKSCSKTLMSKVKRIALEFHELTPDQNHQELIDMLKKSGFKVKGGYHQIENNIGYLYGYR